MRRRVASPARRRSIEVRPLVVSVVGLLLAHVEVALAWNDTAHQIIALIAWDELSDRARTEIVEVLRQAPPDAGLTRLFAQDRRPWPIRQREFFRRASTWPDRVRHAGPHEGQAYHRPIWHYRNVFWRPGPNGPMDLPHMSPNQENVVERLEHFTRLLADPGQPAPARAIGLGWTLHLVGDVHQPFHCSSRVTRQEPDGDLGGNLFRLGLGAGNLHAYWDAMLDRAIARHANESTGAYLARGAAVLVARHPRLALEADLKPGKFEDWAQESLAEAKRAYPPTLRRGQDPHGAYAQWAGRVAIERAARAGYRLAALLEELYGR